MSKADAASPPGRLSTALRTIFQFPAVSMSQLLTSARVDQSRPRLSQSCCSGSSLPRFAAARGGRRIRCGLLAQAVCHYASVVGEQVSLSPAPAIRPWLSRSALRQRRGSERVALAVRRRPALPPGAGRLSQLAPTFTPSHVRNATKGIARFLGAWTLSGKQDPLSRLRDDRPYRRKGSAAGNGRTPPRRSLSTGSTNSPLGLRRAVARLPHGGY